jgi:DNA-binding transcriptional MerR regulator
MTDLLAPNQSTDTHQGETLLPIREVSRITGINPVTLRAWERRYGLVQPIRTESGHRLYSQANIDEVRCILGWIERGVAVSKVGRILARTEHMRAADDGPEAAQGEWGEWQTQVLRTVRHFDAAGLEQLYGQVFSSYPLAVVFEEILMPVWLQLLLSQEHFGGQSEWLMLDGFLRARTLQRLQLQGGSSHEGPTVLLAALDGGCRELELLVAGLMLTDTENTVWVLPLGQPMEELSLICDKVRPDALVLFSNLSPAADSTKRWARLSLSLECPLLLAGEMSEWVQDDPAHAAIGYPPIACLGAEGRYLQRRLQQFLAGHLDA